VRRSRAEAFDEESRYPHPGCFAAKSAEVIEKKGVEFWRVPKSAQECEKKRDSSEERVKKQRSKNIKRKREKTHRLRAGAGMGSRILDTQYHKIHVF